MTELKYEEHYFWGCSVKGRRHVEKWRLVQQSWSLVRMRSPDTSGKSLRRDYGLKVTLKRFVRKDHFHSAERSLLPDSWHANCVLLSFYLLAEVKVFSTNLSSEYFVITSYIGFVPFHAFFFSFWTLNKRDSNNCKCKVPSNRD